MRTCSVCSKQINKANKYDLCWPCYCRSPERKLAAQKCVKNRPQFIGENNPNYKGKTKLACSCGAVFYRRISPSQIETRTHKYCSKKCKHKYSVSKAKIIEYKGIKFRSSWEKTLAEYFDSKNYTWVYEPLTIETDCGFYTPDFWVQDLNCYFEVKGHFRDEESKLKFNYFSQHYKIILADLCYFKGLGFARITSGSNKGQLWQLPVLP